MQTTLRIARTILQNTGRPAPDLTMRQRQTRERILTHAQTLMAACGTPTLKFATVAAAIHVAPTTLRAHFADLDDLLAALVVRHLDTLLAALTEIPETDPGRDTKRRSAYLAATRTASGALAEAHLLLVRDRHFLPPEDRDHIETCRHEIGTLLAGDRAQLVLPILDNPHASPQDIEALLGNLRAAAPPHQMSCQPPHQAARPRIAPTHPSPPAEPDVVPNHRFIPPPGVFAPERLHRAAPVHAITP